MQNIMWMTEYVKEIKRQFRDKYNFVVIGGTDTEPNFDNIPDGVYPMLIDGETDYVLIRGCKINCCNVPEKDTNFIEWKSFNVIGTGYEKGFNTGNVKFHIRDDGEIPNNTFTLEELYTYYLNNEKSK